MITQPLPTDTGRARVARDYLGGERGAFPDSDATWRPIATAEDGVVDLNQLVRPPTAHAAVYAFAYVHSPREETRTLVLASDDDVVAWLNGQRIHYHEVARGTGSAERDTLVVRLSTGWNTLLLKVVNQEGGFGFGAWLEGEPVRTANRRPADARQANLPAATVTAGPLKLAAPLTWRGPALEARGSIAVTAWGPAVMRTLTARLLTAGGADTLMRASVDSVVPGAPQELRFTLDLRALAAAAAAVTPPSLTVAWGRGASGGRVVAPVHAPDRVLALLDARITLDWTEAGTTLSARVRVPTLFAGLTVDLLAAEFGSTARYTVNGAARPWRDGTVPLCDPCATGDSLAIRVDRDPSRPWWDAPRVRVRDRSYSDIAANVDLLTVLGDSSGVVPRPNARVWLSAMLQPDKVQYHRLGEQSSAQLTAHDARFLRDTLHLVGNSHIDAAWLWRADETQGVVENTWRTALKLQEKFRGATFAASAAQYYQWLETRAPRLLDSIRAAADRGSWSVVGGWWLEADQNLPSGESLVRQGLYGQRYFQKRFGRRARIAWTPDSFGYPWTLPQIWRGLGMEAFVTQKIRWNDSTEFPHDAFVWEGRDGTRLFSYNPWGYDHDLNGASLAREMATDNRRTGDAHHMMVLYGVGDHGGGPTIEMLERREDLQRLPAFPVLQDATPEDALQAIRGAHPDSAWPVWKDELYLEYHRGTYTTQAWMKRRNRRSEELLGTTEMLAALDTAPYPRAMLLHAWQRTLFNQFHDLLPGSGIRPIYLDAMLTYDSVEAAATPVRASAFSHLAEALDTRNDGIPVVVFNPSSWVRTSYASVALDATVGPLSSVGPLSRERALRAVDAAGRATVAVLGPDSLRFLAREVPSLGFKVFWIRPGAASHGVLYGSSTRLENDFLVVDVDTRTGQLTRIYDKQTQRDALAPGGRGNVLQLFGDRPAAWDAWDIGYTGEEWVLDSVSAVRAGGDDVERWIEVEKPWNKTRVTQRLVLRRDEPLLEVRTAVDWRETRKLLKVAFDWNATADSAFYEIAYGAIGQPTTPRTQAERAKYEHAGHRWGDLSDAAGGVSLLNDSKYGWDTRGRRMRLSLLRAPIWPDSLADRGRQEFRYAVYPHAGDWRAALTERRAMEFNQPLLAAREPAHPGAAGRSWSFASVDADNVYVTALKRAEDTNAYVLRLVEWHGRPARAVVTFGRPIARVRLANLLEDPLSGVALSRDRRSATLTLRPWEIVTLIVDPGGSR